MKAEDISLLLFLVQSFNLIDSSIFARSAHSDNDQKMDIFH